MLDPTRQKFVESTLRGNGPKQAAIDAGLSEKTAASAGSRLRKDPKIVAALAAIGFATPGVYPEAHKPIHPRKPAPAAPEDQEPEDDPLDDLPQTTDSKAFLEAVQANPKVQLSKRMEAARQLLPYQHAKIGEKGKKETKADGAKQASTNGNAYASGRPPLASVK